MISSTSKLGGGPKHIFSLAENIHRNFKIYYAMPKSENYHNYLSINNHLEIAERKIKINDILKIIEFIDKNQINVIHAHGKGASALARIVRLFLKKPLIYTFHGIHLDCHNLLQKCLYRFFEYFTGFMDALKIFVSYSEMKYAKKLKIIKGENYKIINNGVPNKEFKEDLNKGNSSNKKIKVISICRFVKQKNIVEILKIAKKLEDIEFLIIGDGPLWKNIYYLLDEYNLNNIELIGEKNNVFDYLYLSDIFLSTSLYEGLPISILEAMSIGLPIVASNVIGNYDTIIHSREGYLYDLHNIDMAVKYLNLLANDKTKRISMGKLSYHRQRKNFSIEAMIEKYENVYENMIN